MLRKFTGFWKDDLELGSGFTAITSKGCDRCALRLWKVHLSFAMPLFRGVLLPNNSFHHANYAFRYFALEMQFDY